MSPKEKIFAGNKADENMGIQFIVVLIVALAFAFIYFVWLGDLKIFGENLGDYTICKESNIANAKLKLKIPKVNYLVAEKKTSEISKCVTKYENVPKGKELNTISKKMAGCWDMYLEGKEELFDTEDNNFCAICYVMTFEDKKQITGLTDYLINNNAPGQGKTYYEYLVRRTVTNDVRTETKNSHLTELDKIDGTKPLSVIFTSSKTINPGSLTGYNSLTTGSVGTAVGVIGGFTILAGTAVCSTFTFGMCPVGIMLVTATVGGSTGYIIGSTNDPNVDNKVLLWPYTNEDLSKLKCTVLEGKDTLSIRKF